MNRTFLVECYAPGLDRGVVAAAGGRARLAAAALRAEGLPVEYLGALLVPDDETVFHLFGASEVALARDAATRAGLGAERIVEAVVVASINGWSRVGVAAHPGAGATPGLPRC